MLHNYFLKKDFPFCPSSILTRIVYGSFMSSFCLSLVFFELVTNSRNTQDIIRQFGHWFLVLDGDCDDVVPVIKIMLCTSSRLTQHYLGMSVNSKHNREKTDCFKMQQHLFNSLSVNTYCRKTHCFGMKQHL